MVNNSPLTASKSFWAVFFSFFFLCFLSFFWLVRKVFSCNSYDHPIANSVYQPGLSLTEIHLTLPLSLGWCPTWRLECHNIGPEKANKSSGQADKCDFLQSLRWASDQQTNTQLSADAECWHHEPATCTKLRCELVDMTV